MSDQVRAQNVNQMHYQLQRSHEDSLNVSWFFVDQPGTREFWPDSLNVWWFFLDQPGTRECWRVGLAVDRG